MRLLIAVLALAACSQPVPLPTPFDGGAPLCQKTPTRIYYGSCGAKLVVDPAGPASCVVCEGARGCLAYPGAYCVGARACDDPACR